MAAHPNILRGASSTDSVLAWNSRKIRRVVRRSLGAECAAFSTGLEHTDVFRVLYGELCGDMCDLAWQMLSSLPVPKQARRLRTNASELSSA